MRTKILIAIMLGLIPFVAFGQSSPIPVLDFAELIGTVTSAFNGILSPADDDVQKALDTIDNINHGDVGDMPDVDGTNEDHDPRYYTKDEVNDIVEGAAFDYFLNDAASDIGTYFVMDPTETGEAESSFTDTITNDAFLIDTFATSTSEPTFTELIIGVYDFHVHAETTVGVGIKTVRLYWEFYKRLADSPFTETLLITSEESDILTGSKTSYEIHGSLTTDTVLGDTDRLILKVYANIEDGDPPRNNDPDVTFYAEGTTATHFEVKTTLAAFDGRYVNLNGESINITNGTFDWTTTGSGTWNSSIVSGVIKHTKTGTFTNEPILTTNNDVTTGLFFSDDPGGLRLSVYVNSQYIADFYEDGFLFRKQLGIIGGAWQSISLTNPADSTLLIGAIGGETLEIDFNTGTPNEIGIGTTSGADILNFGALDLLSTGTIEGAAITEGGKTVLLADGSRNSTGQQEFEEGIILDEDKILAFGTASQTAIQWQTGVTNSWLEFCSQVGAASTSGIISICELADGGHANREPASTVLDVHLRLYSSDENEALDYIEIFHDQTNGVINWGNGNLDLAGGDIDISAGSLTISTDLTVNGELGAELDAGAHTIGSTLQTATGDGTTTIDWKLGNHFEFTFGAQNETFTFTAPSNPCELTLIMIQDGTGTRSATLPGTARTPGGKIPLSSGANDVDEIKIFYNGTVYRMNIARNYETIS